MRMKRAIILPMLVLFGSCLYIGTFLYLIVIEESQGMLYQHLYLVLHCAFSVRIIPCIAAFTVYDRIASKTKTVSLPSTALIISSSAQVFLRQWKSMRQNLRADGETCVLQCLRMESFGSTLFAVKKYESKHEAEKQTFCSATNERGLALK